MHSGNTDEKKTKNDEKKTNYDNKKNRNDTRKNTNNTIIIQNELGMRDSFKSFLHPDVKPDPDSWDSSVISLIECLEIAETK